MRKTRCGIISVVWILTLLVRRLRAYDVLLLVLRLVRVLLWRIVLILVRCGIEVPAPLATTKCCGALWRLLRHLPSQVVIRRLGALLVLEDGLGEGGGRGRIDASIGSRVLAVIVVRPSAWKIEVEAIIGVHDEGIESQESQLETVAVLRGAECLPRGLHQERGAIGS